LADRAAAAMAELSVIEAQAVLSRVASILPYHDDPEVSSAVASVLVAANKLGQILGLSTGGRTSRVSHGESSQHDSPRQLGSPDTVFLPFPDEPTQALGRQATPLQTSGLAKSCDDNQPKAGLRGGAASASCPRRMYRLAELPPRELPPRPHGIVAGESCFLAGFKALLIDLDGTMYSPSGSIRGADAFHQYLRVIAPLTSRPITASLIPRPRRRLRAHRRAPPRMQHHGVPFVFLSNTGAKCASGVQSKLEAKGMLAAACPATHIYTAAQAQCAFLVDHVPLGGRVFVIAGGADHGHVEEAWWWRLLVAAGADLVRSWEVAHVRTRPHLSVATPHTSPQYKPPPLCSVTHY